MRLHFFHWLIVSCLVIGSGLVVSGVLAQDEQPVNLLLDEPDLQINLPSVNLTPSSDIKATGPQGNQYYAIPWIAEYISGAYQFIIGAAIALAIIVIIVAGFTWMTAGGNADAVNRAKTTIVGAVTGVLLALGSFSILYIVNPNLTNLTPLRVPIIGRVGLGQFCSPEVLPNETIYLINDRVGEISGEKFTAGRKTTCGLYYSKGEEITSGSICIGSSCGGSTACVPNINEDGSINAYGGALPIPPYMQVDYACQNPGTVCNKIKDDDVERSFGLGEGQRVCDLINNSPGARTGTNGGTCVWVDKDAARIFAGDDRCYWCSQELYQKLAADWDGGFTPDVDEDDPQTICELLADEEVDDWSDIIKYTSMDTIRGLDKWEVSACASAKCNGL